MWSFGFLTCCVGTNRLTSDDHTCVDRDPSFTDVHREPVHPSRCGSTLFLTDLVVLGAMALALEPLRRLALWHSAPEVRHLLVEGPQACLHPELGRATCRERVCKHV